MSDKVSILQLSYGNYVSADDYFKLQSNWNSLREYIKEIPEEEFVNSEWYVNVLDKMNELEGGNKDEQKNNNL